MPSVATVLRAGIAAGLAGGAAMIAWQMLCGEIANEATPVSGVDSSTWTAVTSIAAFILGTDAFSGSFAIGSIAFGLLIHFLVAVAVGVAGAAFLAVTWGARPPVLGAVLHGVAYGLLVEILVLNLIVNAIDDPNLVYHSTPPWSWWIAHAAYGGALGLVLSRKLEPRP